MGVIPLHPPPQKKTFTPLFDIATVYNGYTVTVHIVIKGNTSIKETNETKEPWLQVRYTIWDVKKLVWKKHGKKTPKNTINSIQTESKYYLGRYSFWFNGGNWKLYINLD